MSGDNQESRVSESTFVPLLGVNQNDPETWEKRGKAQWVLLFAHKITLEGRGSQECSRVMVTPQEKGKGLPWEEDKEGTGGTSQTREAAGRHQEYLNLN